MREVAAETLARMGERPGDDQPEKQAEWDALARMADGDVEPEPNGFDVENFNQEFAVVPIGGKVVILWDKPDAPQEERLQFLQVDAFRTMYQNRYTEVRAADGKLKWKTWANAWLDSPRRRQFRGIQFHPDRDSAPGADGYYNLWRGFSVEPRPGGDYSIFRDHLLTNVCGGSQERFRWLFGWFAQMVQEPRVKPGTSIVLRGAMGAGKSKVGEVIGSLFAQHYFQIDNPRYVTGQFNSHMASCLFLQADEAVFAGDKAAEGHLRGIVTGERQMVESKGVDPIRLPNFVRLMMTSNFDWVVPAGPEERRFACFDIAAHAKQNHHYFREMQEQLDGGGRETLLHDLLAFDLSKVNVREIPKTGALLEQKIRSLDPIEQWLYDRLHDGAIVGGDTWPEQVEVDTLYRNYIAFAERIGVRYRSANNAFGIKLAKLLPGVRRAKRTVSDDGSTAARRPWCYLLPPLQQCRDAFDEHMGQPSRWGGDDDG